MVFQMWGKGMSVFLMLEAQAEAQALRATLAHERRLRQSLFNAIAHGDEEHRAWLAEAIAAHFAGKRVPKPRGGNKKARR